MREEFMEDEMPFKQPELVELEVVEKVLKQLSDREAFVCVLGRYNVGKTTLINALLSAK